MKRQQGIANPQTILIAILLTLGALIGLVAVVNHHDTGIREAADKGGYDRGKREQAEASAADLKAAQKLIGDLEAQREANQAAHIAEQARLKAQHDQEVRNANVEAERLRADIAAGRIVLRDPGAKVRVCGPVNPGGNSGGSEAAGAPAAPAGGVEAGTGGLSREAAEFLRSEAVRANEVRADLKLCWSIARDDRRRGGTIAAPGSALPDADGPASTGSARQAR